MTYNLSKSRYCSGVQCPKMLWLKKNMPEEFDDKINAGGVCYANPRRLVPLLRFAQPRLRTGYI